MTTEAKRDSSRNALKRTLNASKKAETFDEADLESYFHILADQWGTFCQAQDKVEITCGIETVEDQETEREQGEHWYREAFANLTRAANKLKAASNLISQPTSDNTMQLLPNTISQTRADIKLPSIPLPHFSGDPKEWRPFHDAFESMIHKEPSLRGSHKLYYLRTSLEGPALQVIRGFQSTDENYEEAWALLKKRFNVQRVIIDSHFRALFALKKVNTESSTALKALLDTTQEHYQSLKALGRAVENWDDWLVHLTVSKFDAETHRQWELSQTKDEVATFDTLVNFLEIRCRSLDAIDSHQIAPTSSKSYQQSRGKTKSTSNSLHAAAPDSQPNKRAASKFHNDTCAYCSAKHRIYNCDKFRSLDISRRTSVVREKNLCSNCLVVGHDHHDCRSSNSCRVCQVRHHTLLHQETPTTSPLVEPSTSSQFTQSNFAHTEHQVLLGTAVVKIVDLSGRYQPARLLFDNGSHLSFITESFLQRLKLKRSPTSAAIEGIGGTAAGSSRGEVQLTLSSYDQCFMTTIRAHILSKITSLLPPVQLRQTDWPHIKRLNLADPHFYTPAPVDILLGSDELGQFLRTGLVMGPIGTPLAQQSTLGWVLFGKIMESPPRGSTSLAVCLHTDNALTKAVSKFWQVESLPEIKHLTLEEQLCEKSFERTHYRQEDGRYVVRLPFKPDCPLGSSRHAAVRALFRMESLFAKDEHLRIQYKDFIHEFIQLGHMEKVSHPPVLGKHYYMPHRAVVKETSTTTKLRVVFNASCRTTTGFSLNDTQMVGPQLQADLFVALVRVRTYRFAKSADVTKMYRQVRVDNEHVDYQRIVWRDSPEDDIEDYRTLTVTYGVASSSHLAVKAIQQCALDEGQNYPMATEVILHHFYMDDLLTGCFEEEELLKLQTEVSTVLSRGGFSLRKWSTNSPLVINAIPEHQREILQPLDFSEADSVRTLGLQWEPSSDNLSFAVQVYKVDASKFTKRLLLSDASRLFDPLGLLSPCTIIPKMIFQRLWKPKVDWDEVVPDDVKRQWFDYRDHITSLAAIKVPRWVGTGIPNAIVDLHGFADASQTAYAAAVYVRTISPDGSVTVHLLTAKTRVAPLKQTTLSIPRLELCAAVLLVQLIKHIRPILEPYIRHIICWTDSTVVLAWIQQHPGRWCTFVANRVSQIQEIISSENWFHVQSAHNPADCATRGVPPQNLANHELWWNGPLWLKCHQSSWPSQQIFTTNLDQRSEAINTASTSHALPPIWDLIDRYSSLRMLKRVTAYILRFVHNIRTAVKIRKNAVLKSTKYRSGRHLQLSELDEALLLWIKLTQSFFFADDIPRISSNKLVSRQSKLIRLHPFLDERGLIRVGGRLCNASLLPDKKHPFLLPGSSRLTTLICEDIHRITLHAGPQAMQAMLQNRFWVISARKILRKIFRLCVKCRRHSHALQQQLMGDLPRPRVVACRPFLRSGVDFAGPVSLRFNKGRGTKSVKGYISVFICMATGAMHLELASDLSSTTFIAAFKRFTSRRGQCRELYSDNGTNFVGAEKELKFLLSQAIKDEKLAKYLAEDGTVWHFNPPAAPHMGGYWEAAVKRVKYHLRRTLAEHLLTFEEFSTLLTEIEACVNSRPLCSISSDVNDLLALTPAHFLIGEPLKAVPEPNIEDFKGSLVKRWHLVSTLRQHFWRRWSSEYIVQLQQRSKWTRPSPNVKMGDLVVLRDERLPPTKWKLGRVIGVHPGPDTKVRVVTLKTADGILTRPIVKISPLLSVHEDSR